MNEAREELTSTDAQGKSQRRRVRSTSDRRERLEIAREITRLFNLERYVYISCCGIAVVLLLINAVMLMQKGGIDYPGLTLLFGASGLITFSIGRLIYMWNKLVDLILTEVGGQEN